MGAQRDGRSQWRNRLPHRPKKGRIGCPRGAARTRRGGHRQAHGRAKEAGGSLTGNKDKKAEGRAEQDKGTLKKKKGAVKDLLK
jgi:uncharacterized protein YjbJ (UPF0337 family)